MVVDRGYMGVGQEVKLDNILRSFLILQEMLNFHWYIEKKNLIIFFKFAGL